MAKGLRSSVKKSNKSKLRSRVFGPVEAARTERMSAKLLELASQPKPAKPQDTKMEIEGNGPESEDQSKVESKAADTEGLAISNLIHNQHTHAFVSFNSFVTQ
ncbi:MAG: hypothetical protein M1817_006539 [Caeruleum heppii]|nr:MAG: hypothetical protein M1817_006539 [Caeruleum heppii]